ncbi:MAG TPA: CorA family divalent cation transporter [Thermoanaerobaculia bacterium]|nr:CorA family divalent cation transporter [Thermoanaerobaculia bacterium]
MRQPDFLFHGVSFNPADLSVRRFTYDQLDRELGDDTIFSWIDVEAADIERLNEILRRWEIDLTLVNQFAEPEVLPRIVERPECLAFYLYEVIDPEHHLDTSRGMREIRFERMILILGPDFVITYHQHPLDAVDYVKETCEASFQLAGKTPGFIAFLFLQRCVYDYAHLNLANDNFLDELHNGVTSQAGAHALVAAKVDLAGRNILTLKKLTASLNIILMILVTKRNRFISDPARVSFSEMLQTAVVTRSAIDSSRDLLDGIVRSVQSAAASRTSEIARVLTIVSAIILPLSLIAGIYGMNFEHMPELEHPGGYYLVLGLMGSLALYLIVVFRRLGWIGRNRS